MERLFDYYGKKDKLINSIRNIMPQKKPEKILETCAGSLSFSINLARGLKPKKITAIELDINIFNLIMVIKNDPYTLISMLTKNKYTMEEFKAAQELKANSYAECGEVERAANEYLLLAQSFNSMRSVFRDPMKKFNDDKNIIDAYKYAKQIKNRFRRQIFKNILNGSNALKRIEIINGNFMDYMDLWNDEDSFVFADVPYRPDLRTLKGKKIKTGYDYDWTEETHVKFLDKIEEIYQKGNLKSQVMICGFCMRNGDGLDVTKDLYCQRLFPLGFRMIALKEVFVPTIGKGKKNRKVECVWINYDFIAEAEFDKTRIFDINDLYEKVEREYA